MNPDFPAAARQLQDMQQAARVVGVELRSFSARTDPEIDAAFQAVAQARIAGLVVAADTLFVTHRDRLVSLAARHAVPAIYSLREFASLGGLMSYGPICRIYTATSASMPAAFSRVPVRPSCR